ncbi:MAG: hypothetical protein RIF33_23250 [Cyclobacteriaceae bacterium]
MRNALFLIVLVLTACGTDEDAQPLCVANPRGEIDLSKVNLTAARATTALLTNESGTSVGDDSLEYTISDVIFSLGEILKVSNKGEEHFSDFVQFEPEQGYPVISFKINDSTFSYDPNESLARPTVPQLQAGIHVYYIIIKDFEAGNVEVVVHEWKNYSEECNDTEDTTI